MTYVKVKDRPDLLKDPVSGAIINIDRKKSDDYLARKSQINKTKAIEETVTELKDKLKEIDSLKDDLNTIKSLLKEIINK